VIKLKVALSCINKKILREGGDIIDSLFGVLGNNIFHATLFVSRKKEFKKYSADRRRHSGIVSVNGIFLNNQKGSATPFFIFTFPKNMSEPQIITD